MPHTNIDVNEHFGCILVSSTDDANQRHRWWFDRTEKDRLVFISEVIHYSDLDMGEHGLDGRHYVPESEAAVPDAIRESLIEAGYDIIVTPNGTVM
jgi:hypothetical protein